ncbi:alternative ribosome rescue aminoacyl-tRNA hydrolase ArfB [Aeromicrobium terrae]|jgi:ribosome-associated protein|uniref:Aminoacyl-tRNA hydrolase n=1 Tax=Aeromicrobium terrae TaxID=2498846 RepID=A0A5C8NL03_9ACTN|nr:alternative ribosome rescue aminoacyl-tRNA hydrolase ArfB [Aeromicrobium terrae]TXL61830.1 aminoacyl-tRNA hydrolase [Aeromicrobium terrae]
MSQHGRLHLPERELSWRFSRSSGAGGQHVNTTDTRVELTWSLTDTAVLSEAQRARVAEKLRSRIVDGTITVVSSRYRSQHRNREAARVRLEELITDAIVPPRPRRPTKPTRASKERRLDAKKRRSDVKRSRRGGWD